MIEEMVRLFVCFIKCSHQGVAKEWSHNGIMQWYYVMIVCGVHIEKVITTIAT